jgi:hypothetical protein
MKNFKFLKIVLDVDRWCGIVLGVFHGSRNTFPVIFGHSKVVFEKNFKLRNSPWKRVFSLWGWIWLVKTRFRVAKLEFFRVQCESHDQTLAARGSQLHYLNSLGTDFSYRFYFLKKIIFWTPMPSKSQNYIEIVYKMLEKKVLRCKNSKFSKSF